MKEGRNHKTESLARSRAGWPQPRARRLAQLGVDMVRCSFIVVDLHQLLLAGLPAHPCENAVLSCRYHSLVILRRN
jgi:hypothetical protein